MRLRLGLWTAFMLWLALPACSKKSDSSADLRPPPDRADASGTDDQRLPPLPTSSYDAGACGSDFVLIASAAAPTQPDQLYRFDPVTVTTSLIGSLPRCTATPQHVQAGARDHGGAWWLAFPPPSTPPRPPFPIFHVDAAATSCGPFTALPLTVFEVIRGGLAIVGEAAVERVLFLDQRDSEIIGVPHPEELGAVDLSTRSTSILGTFTVFPIYSLVGTTTGKLYAVGSGELDGGTGRYNQWLEADSTNATVKSAVPIWSGVPEMHPDLFALWNGDVYFFLRDPQSSPTTPTSAVYRFRPSLGSPKMIGTISLQVWAASTIGCGASTPIL